VIAVRLEPFEVRMAASVAIERRIASMGRLHHAYGYDGANQWENEIQSAAAEMAVGKALGRYWDGSVNTFKRGDVGDVQVRWTAWPNGHLQIRPGDADDDTFILVRGSIPKFTVVGWFVAREAKRPDWEWDDNGRPTIYRVPNDQLHLMGDTAVAA